MKVLFPVVRATDVSERLAPLVKWVAKKGEAELHLLRVEPLLDTQLAAIPEAEKWLKGFSQEHFGDFPPEKMAVIAGDPIDEILKYIEDQEMDLLVIGTHGRRGLDFVIYGSVARAMVGKSPVPVLSINPYTKLKNGKASMYWKGETQ